MSSPLDAPPWRDRYWAKLDSAGQAWHPLIAHAADTAAVAWHLTAPDSTLAARLARLGGWPPEEGRRVLTFVAALHDLGKTSHGFQAKAGADRGRWQHRGHAGVLIKALKTAPAVRAVLTGEVLTALSGEAAAAGALLLAALAHHGRPLGADPAEPGLAPLWAPADGRDPLAEMRRLIAHARRWAGVDGAAWPALPAAATHLVAGVLTLADWLGSTAEAFPFCPAADDDPDGYWREVALPRAAEAVARVGVVPRTRPVSLAGLPLLAQVFPGTFPRCAPTPLQQHVAEMPLPEPGARLLLESETGSGKTEAALALYARLRAAGRVGGLFFALPTRATAGAMHERVLAALAGMYPGGAPTVALAVGGEQPRAEGPAGLAEARLEPDEPDLTHWAADHPKAYLAAEIVVGTVDQALLAALPVKHAHLRLAALSRHLVVVDELHSYDRYLTVLLTRLLDLLGAAGGLALFMSATLSDTARRAFGGGEPLESGAAVARPYPCLGLCPGTGLGWTDTPLASTSPPRPVRWRCAGLEPALAAGLAAARAGARVLFVRNTITAARDAVDRLRALGADDLLWRPSPGGPAPSYHSRYTLPDRLALDAAVRRDFGPAAHARPGGTMLVSTQVAEQSLDVDFDLLLTDLCPIDVLLQRLGRAHRHPERAPHRPAPWREAVETWVVTPEGGFAPRLKQDRVEAGWGLNQPYADYADGELTRRTIVAEPEVVIPRDNRRLVEAVYHPEPRERLRAEPGWGEYWLKADLRSANQGFVARSVALPFERRYDECVAAFDNELKVEYRTRLGLDTVRLELPEPVHGWYSEPAQPVLTADLPSWALPKGPDGQPVTAAAGRPAREGCTSFAVGSRVVWYAVDGWRWEEG